MAQLGKEPAFRSKVTMKPISVSVPLCRRRLMAVVGSAQSWQRGVGRTAGVGAAACPAGTDRLGTIRRRSITARRRNGEGHCTFLRCVVLDQVGHGQAGQLR
jgi:hypothetical protein